MAGNWFFKPGDAGSSPVTSTNIIGMDYGDSRVCKTLAGEFESLASHRRHLEGENKKIKKELLENYLNDGWIKGRNNALVV